MADDIRWKQRLDNFKKARANLQLAMGIPEPDIIQRAGMVQFFEMCFELAWNLLKDYLEDQGVSFERSPMSTLKKAFELGLIENGGQWLKGLEDRNLSSYLYNERIALDLVQKISNDYAPLFSMLEAQFSDIENESRN